MNLRLLVDKKGYIESLPLTCDGPVVLVLLGSGLIITHRHFLLFLDERGPLP